MNATPNEAQIFGNEISHMVVRLSFREHSGMDWEEKMPEQRATATLPGRRSVRLSACQPSACLSAPAPARPSSQPPVEPPAHPPVCPPVRQPALARNVMGTMRPVGPTETMRRLGPMGPYLNSATAISLMPTPHRE